MPSWLAWGGALALALVVLGWLIYNAEEGIRSKAAKKQARKERDEANARDQAGNRPDLDSDEWNDFVDKL